LRRGPLRFLVGLKLSWIDAHERLALDHLIAGVYIDLFNPAGDLTR
jgi:hypothetical protein